MSPTILTASGRYFDLLAPERSQFDINEIAHALANLCRFTGHTSRFYSVAQHSVLTSYLVPEEHALAALLHDAAEAYLGDVASPLKHLLPEYAAIYARVESALLAHYGLPSELPPCVKRADLIMLATEKRDLMPWPDDVWPSLIGVTPLDQPIGRPQIPRLAAPLFAGGRPVRIVGADAKLVLADPAITPCPCKNELTQQECETLRCQDCGGSLLA